MALIEITFDDRSILTMLRELEHRASDLSGALRAIGEDLVDSTQQRFATSTAPNGSRWAANTQLTILRYLEQKSGFSKKTGKITQKGAGLAMSKRPLVGEGTLAEGVHYQVLDGHTLLVGSPEKYAATQQFGAARGSLGKSAPWGDIPARPFLGISHGDEQTILDVLSAHLIP